LAGRLKRKRRGLELTNMKLTDQRPLSRLRGASSADR